MTWRPRFSLRTLVIFTLLCTSGVGLWWHWGPAWVVRDRLKETSGHVFDRLEHLTDGGSSVGMKVALVGDDGASLQDASTGEHVGPEQLHYMTNGGNTVMITSRSPDGSRGIKAGYWYLDPPPNLGYVEIRDEATSGGYPDAPLAVLTHDQREWCFAGFSHDGRHVLAGARHGHLWTWRRRRPEWWWGVFYLKEFWLTAVFAGVFVWSVVRDRRRLSPRAVSAGGGHGIQ